MATTTGTAGNDAWTIINPGSYVLDGLGGTDTLSLGTSAISAYTITLGGDGGVPEAAPSILSSGPCGVTLRYTAPVGTDNCPNPITVNTSGLGSGPNYYEYGGIYTEAYKVTDASGNMATCSFKITVLDPVVPTITCP